MDLDEYPSDTMTIPWWHKSSYHFILIKTSGSCMFSVLAGRV